jgi:hypothetical protein
MRKLVGHWQTKKISLSGMKATSSETHSESELYLVGKCNSYTLNDSGSSARSAAFLISLCLSKNESTHLFGYKNWYEGNED